MQREASFVRKVVRSFDHVMLYEDRNLQEKARSVIPVASLQASATHRLTALEGQKQGFSIQDLLLLELLAWFKKTFFTWVNSPKCEFCRGDTHSVGVAVPTQAELMWGAENVENYQCNTCQRYTRFPRFNHPGKLLETRCGRCGEWANCFTLCCRALGFEARYVLDWTDHVWTEVYSESEKRWLHCDSCENSCDKPLVYEQGWGKKLSYVIAFSKDEVQDVTWRYSCNHPAVLQRRAECRESILLKTIERLCKQRQKDLSELRKKVLLDRLAVELVEFLTPKKAGDGELGGRESGSLAWRIARGETKTAASGSVVIKPSSREIASGKLQLKYCCASDEYVRLTDGDARKSGWDSLVFEVDSVSRKEEMDWGMVYLARREGTARASVSWKFDLSGSGLVLDTVELQCLSTCYEDGHISWRLCGGEQCAIMPPDGRRTVIDSLSGERTLTITAELRRGKGDLAWQHTQLFRQTFQDIYQYPFDIKLVMKKA